MAKHNWGVIRKSYEESGLTIRAIADLHKIKSAGSIVKRAKKDGWVRGQKRKQKGNKKETFEEKETLVDEKNHGGAPPKKVDFKLLDKLCSILATQKEIASIFEMTGETLARKIKEETGLGYKEYYDIKSARGKVSLRRKQFELAMDGNPTILVWLGKQYLKQTDKTKAEITGKDGGPIKSVEITGEMSPKQAAQNYAQMVKGIE